MEFGNCQLPTIGVRTIVDRHSIARNLHHDTQSWNLHHTLTSTTVEFTPNDFFAFYDQWDFLQVSFFPRPWKLIRRLLLRPWNSNNSRLVNHIARTLQRWNYYQVYNFFISSCWIIFTSHPHIDLNLFNRCLYSWHLTKPNMNSLGWSGNDAEWSSGKTHPKRHFSKWTLNGQFQIDLNGCTGVTFPHGVTSTW